MRITSFITLGVCLAISATAQMQDTVKVTLPQATMVGTVLLPAGAYTIRDVNDEGGSTSVVQIRSNAGLNLTAEVMLVSQPDNKPANRTSVVLRREGDHFQMDKIWFEGRDEGYELIPRR